MRRVPGHPRCVQQPRHAGVRLLGFLGLVVVLLVGITAPVSVATVPHGKPQLEVLRRDCDVPEAWREDGFCDCLLPTPSGLPDELETGACPGVGAFECRNVAAGFVPTPLPWSMVGDGVCDCCDGSDEPPEAGCPVSCPQEAQATLERLRERLATHEAGSAKRRELVRRVFQVQPQFWEQIAEEAADLEEARHQGIELQTRVQELVQRGDPADRAEFEQLSEASRQHRMDFRRRALRWHGLVLVVGHPPELWLKQRHQGTHRRVGLVPDLRQASRDSLNHLGVAGLLGTCYNALYTASRYDAKWDLLSDHYVVRVCPLLNVTQIVISAAQYEEFRARAEDPESWELPTDTARFNLGSWDGWEEAQRIAERRMRWWQARQAQEGSDLEIPNSIEPAFDMQLVLRARYTGGDPCWQAPPRSTTVELVCGRQTRVSSVAEDGSCNFVVELETPAFCLPEFREELQHELDLLQRVIAGGPLEPSESSESAESSAEEQSTTAGESQDKQKQKQQSEKAPSQRTEL